MHTHISAVVFFVNGLMILLFLTVWRLLALHAVASKSTTLSGLGSAMLVQG